MIDHKRSANLEATLKQAQEKATERLTAGYSQAPSDEIMSYIRPESNLYDRSIGSAVQYPEYGDFMPDVSGSKRFVPIG
jgi:hypothetical protein